MCQWATRPHKGRLFYWRRRAGVLSDCDREDGCDRAPSPTSCLAVQTVSNADSLIPARAREAMSIAGFLRIAQDIRLRTPHIRSDDTVAPRRTLAITDKRFANIMPIDEFLRVPQGIQVRLPCWRREWSSAGAKEEGATSTMLAITDAADSVEVVRCADLAALTAGIIEDLRQQAGALASLAHNTLNRYRSQLCDEAAVTSVTTRAAHVLEWLLEHDMVAAQPNDAPLGEGTTIAMTQWCRDMDEQVLLELLQSLLTAPD